MPRHLSFCLLPLSRTYQSVKDVPCLGPLGQTAEYTHKEASPGSVCTTMTEQRLMGPQQPAPEHRARATWLLEVQQTLPERQTETQDGRVTEALKSPALLESAVSPFTGVHGDLLTCAVPIGLCRWSLQLTVILSQFPQELEIYTVRFPPSELPQGPPWGSPRLPCSYLHLLSECWVVQAPKGARPVVHNSQTHVTYF